MADRPEPTPSRTFEDSASFHGLSGDLAQALRRAASARSLLAGERIYRANEPYRSEVYVVDLGEIEIRRSSGEVYWAGPGDIIGLSNFLDGQPYTSTAVARGPATVLVLGHNTLERMEADWPELDRLINRYIARRIRSWSPSRQVITGALTRAARTVMSEPLATCSLGMSLREAYATMRSRKVGSLVVVGEDGGLIGILTHAGLCRSLITEGAGADDGLTAAACDPALSVDPSTPLWKVEEEQVSSGRKYVVVVEDGAPRGMISQTDLLRSLIAHQSSVVARVRAADDLAELSRHYRAMGEVAAEALESNRRAAAAVRIISETQLAIQRRCVELTLSALEREGAGPPPAPYALLIMGSGGRKEMLLTPDQDNGIILADVPEASTEQAAAWFRRFCNELNENLATVGYELCKGDIMARNPAFHKTLEEWRRQISFMTERPGKKAARWSNIVFDFDTLYGDDNLTAALRTHLHEALKERSKLLTFMVEDDAEGRPPIGWFNRLIATDESEAGPTVDIKRNGLRIIADAARIFALYSGVQNRNTHDRLTALVRLGVLDADLVDSAVTAYNQLHELLVAHQIAQARRGEMPDKKIHLDRLSPPAKESLRESMVAVKRFQERLQGQFGVV